MALGATMHHVQVTLSDVDRGVYESLDFRMARHPSESVRFLVTRTLAYCLAFEEGIAFSKGGLSSAEEAPLSITDRTGVLKAWIDIGSPSAERLHRASKAAERVLLFTHSDLALLRKEAQRSTIFRVDEIEVWRVAPEFLDRLGDTLERNWKLELVRSDGRLYVTSAHSTLDGEILRESLGEA